MKDRKWLKGSEFLSSSPISLLLLTKWAPHTRRQEIVLIRLLCREVICTSSKCKPQVRRHGKPSQRSGNIQQWTHLNYRVKPLKPWAVTLYHYHRLATLPSRARSLISLFPLGCVLPVFIAYFSACWPIIVSIDGQELLARYHGTWKGRLSLQRGTIELGADV
jgi:hypothetical protein